MLVVLMPFWLWLLVMPAVLAWRVSIWTLTTTLHAAIRLLRYARHRRSEAGTEAS